MFDIQNRRYTGNKNKLMPWIKEILEKDCKNAKSFFDVFAGTGAVTNYLIEKYDRYILNDFLFSNNIIYNGFFLQEKFDTVKLNKIADYFNSIDSNKLQENYFSINFGDKYFSNDDAKKIGFIREVIEEKYNDKYINKKEYSILISSLIYSMDKISNTVGHYEAYIKKDKIDSKFIFEQILPKELDERKVIEIYREDSNNLAKRIKADIAFIDPPYNSRQYSRFYHVLETLTKWDKPQLYGTAMKPKEENMSDYCRNNASKVFEDLIQNLDVKYIVVTYNNTYNSKSSSSKNKITLEEIEKILSKKGETKKYEQKYKAFNSGKTDLPDHKEYLFITKVSNENKKRKSIRSPFFYVGDKYKVMPQILEKMPKTINNYIEPFVGGGSSFLNVEAKNYFVNDIDSYVIKLHKEISAYKGRFKELISELFSIIDKYGLSCSFKEKNMPDKELKKKYVKTYYAKHNKEAYNKLKQDFNKDKKDILKLYVLLIYGFNHMIRFNSKGDFNLPVGNVDFNKNVYLALENYLNFFEKHNVIFYNEDYITFIKKMNLDDSFILLDPPYLISMSEYNKLWNSEKEKELCLFLDELNNNNIKFGITNLIYHKGNTNKIFYEWSKKYNAFELGSNYISFNDNTIKSNSKEVYVTNYGRK